MMCDISIIGCEYQKVMCDRYFFFLKIVLKIILSIFSMYYYRECLWLWTDTLKLWLSPREHAHVHLLICWWNGKQEAKVSMVTMWQTHHQSPQTRSWISYRNRKAWSCISLWHRDSCTAGCWHLETVRSFIFS